MEPVPGVTPAMGSGSTPPPANRGSKRKGSISSGGPMHGAAMPDGPLSQVAQGSPTAAATHSGASEPAHAPPGDPGGGGGHGHGDEMDSTFAFQEAEEGSKAVRFVKGFLIFAVVIVVLQLMELASAVEGTKWEQEKQLEHYGIFLMLFLLLIGMVSGYVLEMFHINWIAEAGGVLLVGLLAGWLIKEEEETGIGRDATGELQNVTKFDVNFFFLMLLPPIILDAGFNMDEMQRRKLFQNIGGVAACAFGGTLISTVTIATIMYATGNIGNVIAMEETVAGDSFSPDNGWTFLESLIFGCLISATDPVTVLAIFGKMGADRDLYSLVFGESVLNDAVAIVLYKTFASFNPHTCDLRSNPDDPQYVGNPEDMRLGEFPSPEMPSCETGVSAVVSAVGMFLKIFIGSLLIGCLMAAISSLTFKHLDLTHDEFFPMENVFLFVFPYMAWMLAESLELSGIVAILFCGFGMDVYTFINLSEATQVHIKKMIKVMAFGCETFVFVYMGMALSLYEQAWFTVPAIIIAILGMAFSRAINVYPICALVNLQRPTRRAVKPAVQHVVWFAGLRGGIAFALGLAAMSDFGCRVPTCLCIIKQELPEGQSTYGFGGELECSEESYSPWKTVEVEGWEELGLLEGKNNFCGPTLFNKVAAGERRRLQEEACTEDQPARLWTSTVGELNCRAIPQNRESCALVSEAGVTAAEACCARLESVSCPPSRGGGGGESRPGEGGRGGEGAEGGLLAEIKEKCLCTKCEGEEAEYNAAEDKCEKPKECSDEEPCSEGDCVAGPHGAFCAVDKVESEQVPCLNIEWEGKEECDCPAGYTGAGQAILTITLICVCYCVLVLGGAAYGVMNHFGVIGIDKERADRIQKLEEQEDFMIMMAERKNSKALNFDKTVITPFLTWQGTNQPRDPLLKKAAQAQKEAQRLASSGGASPI